MKSIFLLFVLVGCTSLRHENLSVSDLSIENSKDSGFAATRFTCMSHLGTDCKWVSWTFPEKEKQIKYILNKKNMNLISAKYSYKPGGMRWYTILSLGLIPSEMVYKNELNITYGDLMGNKSSFRVSQEYGIMAGWLASFFGTLKTTSTIHKQKESEFMNSLSSEIGNKQ